MHDDVVSVVHHALALPREHHRLVQRRADVQLQIRFLECMRTSSRAAQGNNGISYVTAGTAECSSRRGGGHATLFHDHSDVGGPLRIPTLRFFVRRGGFDSRHDSNTLIQHFFAREAERLLR